MAESVITKEEANQDPSTRVVVIKPDNAKMGVKASFEVKKEKKEVK